MPKWVTTIILGMLEAAAAASQWLGRRELSALVCLLVVCGGIWIFVELADEVMEGETSDMDRALLLALRDPQNKADPWGPPWLADAARDVTALGGLAVLGFLTLAVVGYLALQRKPAAMALVVVAIGGGWLISSLLKYLFARPRPDIVPHLANVLTASFPSGHSSMAAITYLTLGALLARMETHRHIKGYFLALAIGLTALIGVSRVYLGVHWPTDVLAGWTFGCTWALACWTIARILQHAGKVERSLDQ